MAKKRLTLFLEEKDIVKLKKAALDSKLSLSDYIVDLQENYMVLLNGYGNVAEFLEDNKKKLKGEN